MTLEQFLNPKTMKFNKIDLTIYAICHSYGQYLITAHYRGKYVTAHTTDSEAFDYLYNPDNKIKHLEAKRHCYYKIVEAFKNSL